MTRLSVVGSPTVNVLLPASVKTGFAAGSMKLKVRRKRARTATMTKLKRSQRRAEKRINETAESDLNMSGINFSNAASNPQHFTFQA